MKLKHMPTLQLGNSLNRSLWRPGIFLLPLALTCFGFSLKILAVVPAPDGGYPGGNTAEGQNALLSLTTGGFNTAVGYLSLRNDTAGELNTAVGAGALFANVGDPGSFEGVDNTATGAVALFSNTTGAFNTANGFQALQNNTTGQNNAAIGADALFRNTTGSTNTALGTGAGSDQTTGGGNIYIGFVAGVAGENDTCYISNIFQTTASNGAPVFVDSNNKLGVTTSSKRFKENIEPMDKASQALFALKPVSFRYKKEIDPAGTLQLGLVAEDVEKVDPDLIVRDKEGKPYSVRYDQVNAMLLNEFLKEHRNNEQQRKDFEAALAKQQKQIEALTAGLRKVSAQLELSKSMPQTVLNNR